MRNRRFYLSENINSWTNEQLFEIFQYVLGLFPSSFSQPGWGPATAELQTNNYRRFWEERKVKTKLKLC